MPTEYVFHSDPGYAWLEVTKAECKRLQVKPSGWSYKKGDMYYLEEDEDAGMFLNAKKLRGETYTIHEEHLEVTPIRNYAHC